MLQLKMIVNWRYFYSMGMEMINGCEYSPLNNPNEHQEREFRSQFGVSWYVCEDVWNLLQVNLPKKWREPKHLLWSLIFLKVYKNEKTHSIIAGTSVKTFRKWAWSVLEDVSELDIYVVSIFYPEILTSLFSITFLIYFIIFYLDFVGKEEARRCRK